MATVAPWTGKMNQILCYDWLPKRVRNLACAMIGYPSGQDGTILPVLWWLPKWARWYYLACAMIGYPSGQDGTILSVLWWLPNWARWHSLACSGLPDVSCKKKFPESHIINPLFTKLVRSRWLEIGFVLFFGCLWTSNPSQSINTQKKNLANIQAFWAYTWSITHITEREVFSGKSQTKTLMYNWPFDSIKTKHLRLIHVSCLL